MQITSPKTELFRFAVLESLCSNVHSTQLPGIKFKGVEICCSV